MEDPTLCVIAGFLPRCHVPLSIQPEDQQQGLIPGFGLSHQGFLLVEELKIAKLL